MSSAVGVDVGGTNLRAALVGAKGEVIRSARRPVAGREPEALLSDIAALVDGLGAGPARIGVGIAGQLWIARGVVAIAPNLGWRDVPLGPMLDARFGRRVRLVNDLNAIAFGEGRAGAGRGAAHSCCIFVGTGVGMGAVCDGRLLEGADGLATEIGHTKIASVTEGRLCGCGERGCLEAYTSGRHLPDLYAEKVAAGLRGELGRGSIDAARIEAAAAGGEPASLALWEDVADRLGRACGNAVTLFNPEVLVLGGGVLQAAPSLLERVIRSIRAYAARSALQNLEITDSKLGDDAGVIGAALLAMQQ